MDSMKFTKTKMIVTSDNEITIKNANKRCRITACVSSFCGGGTFQMVLSEKWSWKNAPEAAANNTIKLIIDPMIVFEEEVSAVSIKAS